MPKLVRPADQPEDLDAVVSVLGNRAKLAIIRYLAHHSPATRAAIAAATGLAAPTLGNYLLELEPTGIITTDTPPKRRRGRVLRYSLNATVLGELLDAMHSYILPEH